jgi:hypothetical protein
MNPDSVVGLPEEALELDLLFAVIALKRMQERVPVPALQQEPALYL